MKNLCLALAFTLVGTFAFANNSVETPLGKKVDVAENVVDNSDLAPFSNAAFITKVEIIELAFDVCTITVSVRGSDGNWYSATATNNVGNCDAAYDAALNRARLLARIFGTRQQLTLM